MLRAVKKLLTWQLLFASCLQLVICDLSQYEINKLCAEKQMSVIAYPGDPTKFIICRSDQGTVGECGSDVTTDPTSPKPKCFDEKKQSCTVAHCTVNRPNTDYANFVYDYCSNDANFLVKLPAEDCEHYYVCLGSNNDAIYEECPKSLHYSRDYRRCMTPLEARCQTLDDICKTKLPGYRFAGTNCYEYYECSLRGPVAKSCGYNQHFDIKSLTCVSASSSTCVDNTNRLPNCGKADNGLYFPHPSCNHFYICVGTVPMEAQCPEDFYFDEKSRSCKKDTKGICNNSK